MVTTDHDELFAEAEQVIAMGAREELLDLNGKGYEWTVSVVRELAVALRAALATQPQPLFEAEVKMTMPSSLHMDGTHPVTLAAWADTETLRQVKGQRVVVYEAVAGSATPTTEDT